MEGQMSAADIAAVTNRGYDDGFGFGGGSGLWLFAILALMWGGNGFFGNRGPGFPQDYARQSDVVYTSAFNQLQDENRALASEIQRVGYDNMSVVKDATYNNLSEIRDLEAVTNAGFANQQKCCCDTLRAIDGVNYNGAINTASINANTTAQVQKILDKLSESEIKSLQAQVNQLQLQSALCGIVRYPTQTTYSSGVNPFGYGCGCNGNNYNI